MYISHMHYNFDFPLRFASNQSFCGISNFFVAYFYAQSFRKLHFTNFRATNICLMKKLFSPTFECPGGVFSLMY